MEFTPEEWLSLAKKLEQTTALSKLKWGGDENPFEPESGFRAKAPGGAVYVLRSRDFDAHFPFLLSIYDNGAELASFTTVPYTDEYGYEPNDPSSEQIASRVVAELYSDVTRLVTGAPQKAKQLLSDLDDLLDPDNDLPF